MRIEILGVGCQRCVETERVAREAVTLAGITADIVHVTDARTIAERRAGALPAVALDGMIRLSGRVPSAPELVKLLIDHLAATEGGGDVNYAAGKDPGG